jgi:tRNA dimethylallyltransferase
METRTIALVGATNTGKIGYAKHIYDFIHQDLNLKAEIINLDSRKIYKDFQVSQHLIWESDKGKYITHLYGEVSPKYEIDLYDFKELVQNRIEQVHSRNAIPILVGGSTLHFRSVLENWDRNTDSYQNITDNILVLSTLIHNVEFAKSVIRHVDSMLKRGLYSEFRKVYDESLKGHVDKKLVDNTIGYKEFLSYSRVAHKNPIRLNRLDIDKIKKLIVKSHFDFSYKQEVSIKKLPYVDFIKSKKQAEAAVRKFLSKIIN